jgi:hypothetical protein
MIPCISFNIEFVEHKNLKLYVWDVGYNSWVPIFSTVTINSFLTILIFVRLNECGI